MRTNEERFRIQVIRRYKHGESISNICASVHRSRCWFYKWLYRSKTGEKEWYKDHSKAPLVTQKTSPATENLIIRIRKTMTQQNDFYGAQQIQWEMETLNHPDIPSLRTINRILDRNGLTVKRQNNYVPKSKKYPNLYANRPNQIHQLDFVGPRYGTNAMRYYTMNTIDLFTRRCSVSPLILRRSQDVINSLWAIWHRLGIPEMLQVDNEMVFWGSTRYPRGMGCLIRLCLNNRCSPVFIPTSEPWRNSIVEKFNDHLQDKCLRRTIIDSHSTLIETTLRFENRFNSRYRIGALNGQTPMAALKNSQATLRFPMVQSAPDHPLDKPEYGSYNVIRFIRSDGIMHMFGEQIKVPSSLIYEYALATIDVKEQILKIYDANFMLITKLPYIFRP
jgi:putative transposase